MLASIVGGAALLGAFGVVRGRIEAGKLHMTEVEVPVHNLPDALDGFEIIHLSDVHWTGYGPYEQTLLRALRHLSAPVVALTGDYLDGPGGAQALIPMLMEIGRDRVTLAVLGNNDYGRAVNTEALVRDLTRAGARVLVNDAHVVHYRGQKVRFVGVDDPHTGRADVAKAFAALPPPQGNEREPVIVLAHSPDVFPQLKQAGADLVLAGHTHGGQICLPGGYPIVTNTRIGRRFARGLITEGQTAMFVSRGVGTSGVRMRLFCPPEVAVVRLVRAPGPLNPAHNSDRA